MLKKTYILPQTKHFKNLTNITRSNSTLAILILFLRKYNRESYPALDSSIRKNGTRNVKSFVSHQIPIQFCRIGWCVTH